MRFRAAVLHLVLVGLGIGLALGLTEVVLVTADVEALPDSGRPWEIPSDRYGWSYRPGATFTYNGRYERFRSRSTINAQGLRERDYAYDKPDGVVRILILGDSLTASLEVPLRQTWHELLETQLSSMPGGRPVEVIAAGIQGWSTDQEYLYYLHEGVRYLPDLVLLQFYPNDVYGDGLKVQQIGRLSAAPKKPFFLVRDGRLVQIPAVAPGGTEPQPGRVDPPPVRRQLRPFARSRSYLYGHLRTYRLASRVKRVRSGGAGPVDPFCYD